MDRISRPHTLTRRALLGLIAVSGTFRNLLASPALPEARHQVWQRRYKVSATVSFCGVTIFSRGDVGGGYAVAEEVVKGDVTTVALQFAGGSWPEKAHGVNRLGFIQEMVTEGVAGVPQDAAYFGFMTSSQEKSFDQARKAMNTEGKMVPYTATEGSARSGKYSFDLHRLLLPAKMSWGETPGIVSHIKETLLTDKPAKSEESAWGEAGVPNTFLNSMRQALMNPAVKTDGRLVYNGTIFRLRTEKQIEASGLMRLAGTLEEAGKREQTPFKLWVEQGSGNFLPMKIEYKAKSFLKLVFEFDPHAGSVPATRLFLIKENA